MPSGIHSTYNPYGKNLARQKQRRFFLKIFIIVLVLLGLAGSAGYLLFFSSAMRITETNINGLKTIQSAEIFYIVESLKNESLFGRLALKPQLNIIFFDDKYVHDKITNEYAVVKSVNITKEFPHKITIDVEERTPLGTWCFVDSKCGYFDESGTFWGRAIRSSGSLLLNVDDLRVSNEPVKKIESETLKPIMEVVGELDRAGIKITKIEIPEGSIGDFWLYSIGRYYLMFNNETKIIEQAKILKILLDEKGENFSPEYIDLRIDGRVYYK